jgi:hypothetical protein
MAMRRRLAAQRHDGKPATVGLQITDLMELDRHGAHSFWGLLHHTALTIRRTRCYASASPQRKSTHVTRQDRPPRAVTRRPGASASSAPTRSRARIARACDRVTGGKTTARSEKSL